LTAALHSWNHHVVEVTRAARPRGQSKNDTNDAVVIARAALANPNPAQPRQGNVRDRLRLLMVARDADVATRTRLTNQLKAGILTAPTALRGKLHGLPSPAQIEVAARMRIPKNDDNLADYVQVLRDTARQIQRLTETIDALEKRIDELTTAHAAPLRGQFGVGAIVAAQILISWSHHGRFRDDAAFAALAGTAPLEASSGKTVRHRLNRTGDRRLNAAFHRIVLTRRTHRHPETMAYIARRTAEGKTLREITRCLKRALTRRIYRILNTMPAIP
jgi:transposase